MSKRKKSAKRRKKLAVSTFALEGGIDRYETEPLYQRRFEEGDMTWLADEYRKRSSPDPSLTLEGFAAQYGVSVDELRLYLPELEKGISRSIVVWHGTSQSRAASILKEGFRPKVKKGEERRIFFTQNPAVARGYARSRSKGERDSPAVIQCAIDLNEYQDYQRRGGGIFAFKAECISSEVVRRVVGRKKEAREKPEKRKKDNNDIIDIALTYNSGHAAIAYWVNSYLELSDDRRIPEDYEGIAKIKQWLDDQTEEGRFGEVPDVEMLKQVEEHLLEHLEHCDNGLQNGQTKEET